jgi:hypothetical protein
MTPDDLERILGTDEPVQPSSTFAINVMAAVHRDAAELPRPRFPWLRFGIGVTGSTVTAAAATVVLNDAAVGVLAPVAGIAPELSCAAAALLVGLGLIAIPRVLSPL